MPANRSMPAATIIPELPYDDIRDAADWLRRAFGASRADDTAASFTRSTSRRRP